MIHSPMCCNIRVLQNKKVACFLILSQNKYVDGNHLVITKVHYNQVRAQSILLVIGQGED